MKHLAKDTNVQVSDLVKDPVSGAFFELHYETSKWIPTNKFSAVCKECATAYKIRTYLPITDGYGRSANVAQEFSDQEKLDPPPCGVHGCVNPADYYYDYDGEVDILVNAVYLAARKAGI